MIMFMNLMIICLQVSSNFFKIEGPFLIKKTTIYSKIFIYDVVKYV